MSKKKIDGPEVFYFPPFHPRCRCTVIALDDKGQPLDPSTNNDGTKTLLESYEQQSSALGGKSEKSIYENLVDKNLVKAYPIIDSTVKNLIRESFDKNDPFILGLKSIQLADDETIKKYNAENSLGFLANSNALYINKHKCGTMSEVDKLAHKNVELGIFADFGQAQGISYVFQHEYGHFVYDNYEAPLAKSLLQVFATRLWSDQCSGKFAPLSAAAALSKSEMMAESFAQMKTLGSYAAANMGYTSKKLDAFMREMDRLKKREKELLRTKDVDSLMQSCFEIIDKVMQD